MNIHELVQSLNTDAATLERLLGITGIPTKDDYSEAEIERLQNALSLTQQSINNRSNLAVRRTLQPTANKAGEILSGLEYGYAEMAHSASEQVRQLVRKGDEAVLGSVISTMLNESANAGTDTTVVIEVEGPKFEFGGTLEQAKLLSQEVQALEALPEATDINRENRRQNLAQQVWED